MVMETPSPQCVGREFVRQYYTLLHEAPDHLHRFYSHNSSFVHGGVEKPGEEQPPVMGQQDIHKKILSLNFRDCHAKIRQVDSQSTVGSAVVVQVTGELSNNGEPMRRFMQTFVLAPQSPKKYYVHNDIFRYQDEVFHDNDAEPETQEENAGMALVDSEPENLDVDNQAEPSQEQTVNYYEQQATQPPLSNGNAHMEEVAETQAHLPVSLESDKHEESEAAAEVNSFEEKEPQKVTEPEPQPEPQVTEVSKTFSWAAMASKNTAPSGAISTAMNQTAVVKPQPVVKTETKTDISPNQPQPQRAPRPPRNERPRERENSRSGLDGDDMRRSRYPDAQQLFVGNLPHNIVEKELKAHFETFGKVAEVRINRKSTNRDVPNFGFVVFEVAETVQQVLDSKPIMLRGEHRLNVEEKKQRGEQGGRPGSGTRIGGRGGMGGGIGRGSMGSASRGGGRGGPPRMENRGGGRGGFGSAPRR